MASSDTAGSQGQARSGAFIDGVCANLAWQIAATDLPLAFRLEIGLPTTVPLQVGNYVSADTEEDQQAFYDGYANRVSRRLLATARPRIAEERHRDWQDAFGESGSGSTLRRARIIADDVYAQAAPIPQAIPTPDGNAFIREVINAFRETAVELNAGSA